MKKAFYLMIAGIGILSSCGDGTSNSSTISTVPSSPTRPSTKPSSTNFDELSLEDKIDYLTNYLNPYKDKIISYETGYTEKLTSISDGGVELYSKDTFEATRYSITSSPLIVRSGKIENDEGKSEEYDMQMYHDSSKIYHLYNYHGDSGKIKDSTDYKGDDSSLTFQFIDSILNDLDGLIGFEGNNTEVNIVFEENETIYLSYEAIQYNPESKSSYISTKAEWEFVFNDNVISKVKNSYESKQVAVVTQSVHTVTELSFKYEDIQEFDGTLYNPSDFSQIY